MRGRAMSNRDCLSLAALAAFAVAVIKMAGPLAWLLAGRP